MKKNKMMRLASALLVAVLLTTSVISGTFAKYVTSDSVSDLARVAKFGVVVTAGGTLFSKTYATDTTPKDAKDTDSLSVVSSDDDKVVAPGTKNADGLTITVTGKPEVDVKVAFDFAATNEDVFLKAGIALPDMTTGDTNASTFTIDGTNDYYPIVYTLTKDGNQVAQGNLDAIKTYIANNYAGYYNANTDLSTAIGALKLTWAWDFSDTSSVAGANVDKADTLLGDLAANADSELNTTQIGEAKANAIAALVDGTDYNLDVNVAVTVSVTQVD